jgi:hypothetical protein
MPRIVLVQPDPGTRISGGYLYNAQMAEHGAWELLNVAPGGLDVALDDISADLVIADSIWLTETMMGPFLRLSARGTRVTAMMHSFPSMIAAADSGTVRTYPTTFEEAALGRLGFAIAPGPYYGAMLSILQMCRGFRWIVCEPGLEDAWRRAPRRRTGACSLVAVGAVTPRKGFLDALEVLARRPGGWNLCIVGSLTIHSDYAKAVAEMAAHLEGVTLVGPKTPGETRDIVTGADVLVMPSYDENHPLVVLEAMAASVPTVAYAAGATKNMLDHDREGLVGPIGDKTSLARHLFRLVDDEPERYRLADGCWKRQKAIPSWASAAARARTKLEALLRDKL